MVAERTEILHVPVHRLEERQLLNWVVSRADGRCGARVTYLTAWSLVMAQTDLSFLTHLREFDLVYSDGMGVVWSAWFTGAGTLKKVTANDFFFRLCGELSNVDARVALIGSKQWVVDKVAGKLRGVTPRLRILHRASGYLSAAQEEELRMKLKALQPEMIVLAMGQPRQEAFACKCAEDCPHSVIYCVGGLFDYIAGVNVEPPHWMRKAGLEWLFRLITRPQRMWRRYLLGLPILAFYIMRFRAVRFLRSRST